MKKLKRPKEILSTLRLFVLLGRDLYELIKDIFL